MSFRIENFPRDTSREDWNKWIKILRKYGELERACDPLAARAELKAELEANVVDGRIAIVVSGMDCDCVQYTHGHIEQYGGVIWFERLERNEHEWADGPKHVGFCKPKEKPKSESRDLALEAYEDGRPHLISSAL